MNPKNIEIKEQVCPHCHEHLMMNIKSFANHVRWCKSNPNRQQILKATSDNVKKSLRTFFDSSLGEIKTYLVTCERCGKQFEVSERTNKHPERKHYFCSRACANSHKVCDEHREKVRTSVRKYLINHPELPQPKARRIIICPNCDKQFETTKKTKKYCCNKCAIEYRTKIYRSNLTEYNRYRKECQFRFNLKDFPEEFDFELIKKYGMYKAKNRGNNPDGINRDHMFSILEGYRQNVDPYLISHPANCQLLLHSDNIKKRDKCSITLEQLKQRVCEWDERYQG